MVVIMCQQERFWIMQGPPSIRPARRGDLSHAASARRCIAAAHRWRAGVGVTRMPQDRVLLQIAPCCQPKGAEA